MTTAFAHWARPFSRPHDRPRDRPQERPHNWAREDAAFAVVPAVGPLPPLTVRTAARGLDSRAQD